MNVPNVVNYVLNVIYKNPKKYFPKEFDKNGITLPVPTRANFRKLVMGTLTDFNIFKSRIGIFKQQQGLPMGGCLSPLLSNLFLHKSPGTGTSKIADGLVPLHCFGLEIWLCYGEGSWGHSFHYV